MAEVGARFIITGMDCAECAKTIERGVAKLPGVTACSLNFGSAVLRVEGTATDSAVIARVRSLGFGIAQEAHAPAATPAGLVQFLLSRTNTALALLGALLILPSLIFDELLPSLGVSGPWLTATALGALLAAGVPVAQGAWRSLRIKREITIHVLMTLAAIGAVVIGAYTEAGLIMVLFVIGEALEGYSTARARASISALLRVAPDEAILIHEEGGTRRERRVPIRDLKPGDVILTPPGARIAMDGVVVSGVSTADQSPITGESMPVELRSGSSVYAGAINGVGALTVRVTRLAADNMLSRIIALVENAQAHKAPAERFIDRFARVYTPIVVALAGLLAIAPPLLLGQPFWGEQGWLYRALELLVVACPCALVISTPVSIVSAIANAARNGVLIKGGAALEALSSVRVIAFDKTGTLTAGKPVLTGLRAIDCASATIDAHCCEPCDELLALAAAVERNSGHPLAHAVLRAAEKRGLTTRYAGASAVRALPGIGVTGVVNGTQVLIGSHSYFDQAVPHTPALCEAINTASAQGQTPLLIGVAGRYRGYLTVADTPRENSRSSISALNALGVTPVMLTGDAAGVAQAVAAQTGVREVRAGLLPEHKASAIGELTRRYGGVAMVGDGINDAPALATAAVGIAMGAGAAQAIETADVTLMRDDLSRLPYAIRLARKAMRTIRVNIAFAIGVKLAFLALVLAGLGSLWLAVLADVGASLAVTAYSMRLLRVR